MNNVQVLLVRFQKFLLIGAFGLLINMGTLYVLTGYVHIYYVLSSFFAIELSLFATFALNERWTWADRKPGTIVRRFWKYQMVNGIGLVINVGVLFFLTSFFDVHYMASNFFGAGLAALWNFTLNNVFTWGDFGKMVDSST